LYLLEDLDDRGSSTFPLVIALLGGIDENSIAVVTFVFGMRWPTSGAREQGSEGRLA
jgi:hypothetical protein